MTITILTGDCRQVLPTLQAGSVNCIVTSPPYFGLRDYGVAGQMGLEPTPGEFVSALVGVLREARRVLRDDGTMWLNLGDSYSSGGRGSYDEVSPNKGTNETPRPARKRGSELPAGLHETARRAGQVGRAWVKPPVGYKPKDLLGIPWMVAFALRADGWYLRQDIIWSKPNPMPESVTDRCTKAHEYIFLLSKSPHYYFDQDAVTEDISPNTHARLSQDVQTQIGSDRAHAGGKTNGTMKAVGRKFDPAAGNKNNPSFDAAMAIMPERRNKRSVWTVATHSFKEAHFATFPPALIEPCILAGCPKGGVVLDPFGGAGTTGLVADRHGRNAILIELNPDYAAMARKRISGDAGLFAEVS